MSRIAFSTEPPSPVGRTVVVGAGPAGLLATLRASTEAHEILLVDHGKDFYGRRRPDARQYADATTAVSGFGGAALLSCGRMRLTHRVGTTLSPRFPPHDIEDRQREIDTVLLQDESEKNIELYGTDMVAAAALAARATECDLDYTHYPVRELDGEQLFSVMGSMRERIAGVGRILCGTRCMDVRPSPRSGSRWEVWLSGEGGEYPRLVHADNVVLAPGAAATAWLHDQGQRLGLPSRPATPEIGLHLEGPRDLLEPLLTAGPDPLLTWQSPDGATARCLNPWTGDGIVPAPGHQGAHRHVTRRTDRSSNRAQITLLVRCTGPQALTASQARVLAFHGGVIAQTLGDFFQDRPTTGTTGAAAVGYLPSLPKATTGSLSTLLPRPYREAMKALIIRLAKLSPSLLHEENLLYGLAVQGIEHRFDITDSMQAPEHPGLYLVGDGPGLTDGIMAAAETGWIAGDAIAAQHRPMVDLGRLVPQARNANQLSHDPIPAA
ncbi:dehydrogenase [Streptomyces sp. S1D4-20]|uniref:dehydrogenase n=1 Tax=Streptomyces sp. S1D4-20 TaxID=2594462 RepID=UPI00116425CA|nr:dehydrogenase [Streptomyces sp. S1D4-20]QDN54250.1 dehydrogenase [Streptomyces sp. S1D4-20]